MAFIKKHIFLTIILVIVFALILCNYYYELEQYDKVADMLNNFDGMFPAIEQMYRENIEVINRVSQIVSKLSEQGIEFAVYEENGEVFIKFRKKDGEYVPYEEKTLKDCELLSDSKKKDIIQILTNKSYQVYFSSINDNGSFCVNWLKPSDEIFCMVLYREDLAPRIGEWAVKKIDNINLPDNWKAIIRGAQYPYTKIAEDIEKGEVPIRPFFMPRMKPKPHRNA